MPETNTQEQALRELSALTGLSVDLLKAVRGVPVETLKGALEGNEKCKQDLSQHLDKL